MDGGRRLESRKQATPVVFSGGLVLLRQPFDVLAERPNRQRRRMGAVSKCLIGGKRFLENQPMRPAVEQCMVESPNQQEVRDPATDERQPKKRRSGEIESTPAVGRQPFVKSIDPIEFFIWNLDFVGDDLVRIAGKRRAECDMALGHEPPRLAEGVGIDGFRQGHDQLLDVDAAAGLQPAVEQHARLQGGERISRIRDSGGQWISDFGFRFSDSRSLGVRTQVRCGRTKNRRYIGSLPNA